MTLPTPQDVASLETQLSEPDEALVETFRSLDGHIAFLGVGGKMGPTMARMAVRASEQAGTSRRIYGVSRFHDQQARQRLESWGVETIVADLLDERSVDLLPDCENIVYLVGFKFGASQAPATTWAINCYVPALVCRRFTSSRIVAMSSGNVYGMVSADSSGSREADAPDPIGEYAMAALGRERNFQFFSERDDVKQCILRLNYATELRYGVLVDIAQLVWNGDVIDLSMPAVNVIWLRDANLMSLQALRQCAAPANILNVAGQELVSVASIAQAFGERFDKPVRLSEAKGTQAFLNDGRQGHQALGAPAASLEMMIDWTAIGFAMIGLC